MKTGQSLLSTVIVYALAVGTCCAAEHQSGLKEQIVFQSDRDGNVEVFRLLTRRQDDSVYERHSGKIWGANADIDNGQQ